MVTRAWVVVSAAGVGCIVPHARCHSALRWVEAAADPLTDATVAAHHAAAETQVVTLLHHRVHRRYRTPRPCVQSSTLSAH